LGKKIISSVGEYRLSPSVSCAHELTVSWRVSFSSELFFTFIIFAFCEIGGDYFRGMKNKQGGKEG
jgi:hypothetical protein